MTIFSLGTKIPSSLKRVLKVTGRKILGLFNLIPVKESDYLALISRIQKSETSAKWCETRSAGHFETFMQNMISIHPLYSQLQQDFIALYIQTLHCDNPGYFVEFGASDGITYSNSYLLEKIYSWDGILAEPAKGWFDKLATNRSCYIETKCVWSKSGDFIEFNEVSEGEYSTIEAFTNSDHHSLNRVNGVRYKVETISLKDLLLKANAPRVISYLSIDTEGSELQILSEFDFESFKFNFITVEHNYSQTREQIKNLLEKNGYRRIFANKSEWDDWYIRVCKEVEDFIYETQ